VVVSGVLVPGQPTKIGDLVEQLEATYCGTIGFEYMHIMERDRCNWIRERIERAPEATVPAPDVRRRMLDGLLRAHLFEDTLRTKYPSQKGFGLEGAWSFIPGVIRMIDAFHAAGGEHMMFGLAHRGRLAFLSEVMQKPRESLFKEFNEGGAKVRKVDDFTFMGDVKYHLGASCEYEYDDGGPPMHLTLLPNPSHLEAVDPVVEGKTRARQHFMKDHKHAKSMSVIVHGDASFAGQGVVSETMELSGLRGYDTGGTIHIVINNRIGFTTNPRDARTSVHPTDLAKAVGAPILHVNGDDVDAMARASTLAVEWRTQFSTDVVIDIVCYRKLGHNEGDQPMFTQPHMYQLIKKCTPTLDIYRAKLLADGVLSEAEFKAEKAKATAVLKEAFKNAESYVWPENDIWGSEWDMMVGPGSASPARDTNVDTAVLGEVIKAVGTVPEGFDLHLKVRQIIDARLAVGETGKGIDWGTAEALAFGTLLKEGFHVRLSGQDVERGTFSHRHSVLHSQTVHGSDADGGKYIPLENVSADQAEYTVCNSSLSEFAVLGFEYGYSLENPKALVLWEAQFGDFSNGAQIIIDQFISCAESKWKRQSSLVMLLPHGYEHGGPEHSSCRPERFLQMFDDDPDVIDRINPVQSRNWQIVNPTTPANYFHVLRRQVHRNFRKPLIVISPKFLLRLPEATSTVAELTEGPGFISCLQDSTFAEGDKARRLIFCSGKVYYELAAERAKRGLERDVAIVRLEQLAPFPYNGVQQALAQHAGAEVVFAQEEPKNGGFWTFVKPRLELAGRDMDLDVKPRYVGRPPSGPPATGSAQYSRQELAELQEAAFGF
jgi:2-oxoglutarate dehydrogenase E1 component